MLNFRFARLVLQNAYFEKYKQTEDDQNTKKRRRKKVTKKLGYQNETDTLQGHKIGPHIFYNPIVQPKELWAITISLSGLRRYFK